MYVAAAMVVIVWLIVGLFAVESGDVYKIESAIAIVVLSIVLAVMWS